MKKEFLYNDTNTYNTWKKKEDILFKILERLEAISEASLGEDAIDNYKLMLASPKEYFVERYWELWGKKVSPPHANKEYIFETQTRVGVNELISLKIDFDKALNELGKYKPTINIKGVHSNLKQEMFDKYLNPAKEKEYNALKRFLKASKQLKEFGSTANINLFRYASNTLQMKGLEVTINLSKFV